MKGSLEQRWRAKVHIGQAHSCWLWTGSMVRGYGHIVRGIGTDGPRNVYAHRVAWEIFRGPIPDGMEVCHHCDNPACVNPDHLFLGTHAENMADMADKGRHPGPCLRGESHPRARLTHAAAGNIRMLLKLGSRRKDAAAWFGITKSAVDKIASGEIWRAA